MLQYLYFAPVGLAQESSQSMPRSRFHFPDRIQGALQLGEKPRGAEPEKDDAQDSRRDPRAAAVGVLRGGLDGNGHGGTDGALDLLGQPALRRLRAENARLRAERDLLKKAAAYFASPPT